MYLDMFVEKGTAGRYLKGVRSIFRNGVDEDGGQTSR